ncbi:hypothetical protein K437DRAFT_14742 [Tilletiaria anomala UBC 951]|uniref:Uncharacterized protein n=1 Tax=Tilletiaria anomala (strain ATCC 24038 / CBS 436.72 / UBC 951) TaxID=1037660 RepID=A0A066VJZ9_TILAU|nr:uncharacterized protein K437DRAFT_14742 [Tilletiaria anomala UBC 951]KDN39084.1 hypothetical protein K437DRAFT_14742 [Tilletiaria anomala UBC 951]
MELQKLNQLNSDICLVYNTNLSLIQVLFSVLKDHRSDHPIGLLITQIIPHGKHEPRNCGRRATWCSRRQNSSFGATDQIAIPSLCLRRDSSRFIFEPLSLLIKQTCAHPSARSFKITASSEKSKFSYTRCQSMQPVPILIGQQPPNVGVDEGGHTLTQFFGLKRANAFSKSISQKLITSPLSQQFRSQRQITSWVSTILKLEIQRRKAFWSFSSSSSSCLVLLPFRLVHPAPRLRQARVRAAITRVASRPNTKFSTISSLLDRFTYLKQPVYTLDVCSYHFTKFSTASARNQHQQNATTAALEAKDHGPLP